MKGEERGMTYVRKEYRFIKLSKVVHRALSNKCLRRCGASIALDYILKVHTVILTNHYIRNPTHGGVRGMKGSFPLFST